MPTPRTVVAAAVVALCISCACAAVREIPFPKKVEAEWQDWHDAFSATAVDGVVQRASIPALFREHFTLVHASLPGHEAHSELTKEDESIFQDEAQQFERFLAAQGVKSAAFTSDSFRKHMLAYMEDKVRQAAAMHAQQSRDT